MLVPKGHELQYDENLKFVRSTDLSSNKLSGSIPVEISVLSELRFLNLSRNHLIKHLIHLDLRMNFLSGPIPSSVGNLSQMKVLLLGSNKLNGTVPKSFGLLSNLFAVSISHNFFTGSLDEAHFSKLGKLKHLDISYTPLFFNVNSN